MAKRKTRTKSRRGWIAAVALLMVAAISFGVIGAGTSGFKDWSFGRFSHKQQGQASSKGDNTVITSGESNGIELCSAKVPVENYANYGIDPQSVENVYELSVTYTPADTTFQDTNYTLAFKNPNSTWATGKNIADYAELQHESGSKNAVLTVKQAFSEQLVVKATNQRHTEISCTINVDYVCTDLSIELDASRYIIPDENFGLLENAGAYYEWSNGTIAPVAPDVIDEANIILHAQVKDYIAEYSPTEWTYKLVYAELTGDETISWFDNILLYSYGYHNMSADERTAFEKAMCSAYSKLSDGDVVGQYWFTYDRIYNGVDYGEGTTSVRDIDFVSGFAEYYEVSPTGMTSNNSHVVAG